MISVTFTYFIEANNVDPAALDDVPGTEAEDSLLLQSPLSEGGNAGQCCWQRRWHDEGSHIQRIQNDLLHRTLVTVKFHSK